MKFEETEFVNNSLISTWKTEEFIEQKVSNNKESVLGFTMDLSQKDSAEESQNSSESSSLQISDLPEEILEYILIHLSPYRDLKCAMSVNRQWYRLVQGMLTYNLHCIHGI